MDVCNEAREIISASNRERLEDLGKLLRLCESPVEQILIAALFARWNPEVNLRFKRLQCHLSANYPAWDGVFTVCVEPQRTVTTLLDDKYRTDIYIYITRFRRIEESDTNSRWPELARLVVEVDGHAYHERTKEQASYDKKRDRDLALEACRSFALRAPTYFGTLSNVQRILIFRSTIWRVLYFGILATEGSSKS
jgi:hypothetical protein